MQEKKRTLYFEPVAGLGNRLRGLGKPLVSAGASAKQLLAHMCSLLVQFDQQHLHQGLAHSAFCFALVLYVAPQIMQWT